MTQDTSVGSLCLRAVRRFGRAGWGCWWWTLNQCADLIGHYRIHNR